MWQGTRREFLVSTSMLLLAVCARAQQTKKPSRIGVLSAGSVDLFLVMFRQGMGELGYVEGRDFIIEARSAQGNPDHLARFASELAVGGVDIIVTVGSGIEAARKVTQTIPIVVRITDDPVERGYAQSLARPGGNITGVTSISAQLNSKRLELLRDAFPKAVRVGVIWDPTSASSAEHLKEMQSAARILKLELIPLALTSSKETAAAIRLGVERKVAAIVTIRNPVIVLSQNEIIQLAAKHQIPAIYDDVVQVHAGGLMSYGADLDELHRQLAYYVDKILKGVAPGTLPIQQPTRFTLAVNLKTAKTLGITIPPTIMVRADKVIQ